VGNSSVLDANDPDFSAKTRCDVHLDHTSNEQQPDEQGRERERVRAIATGEG
jgi:hypothetical protein